MSLSKITLLHRSDGTDLPHGLYRRKGGGGGGDGGGGHGSSGHDGDSSDSSSHNSAASAKGASSAFTDSKDSESFSIPIGKSSATPYSDGGGKAITLPSGTAFPGREAGGGARVRALFYA